MKGKRITVKLLAGALALAMTVAPLVPLQGFAVEYAYSSNNTDIKGWSVTQDGENLTLSFGGKTGSPYYMMNECGLTYSDGTSGTFQLTTVAASQSGEIRYNWGNVNNGKVKVKGDVSGNYETTVTIPLSFFQNKDFVLNFCGTAVSSKDILGQGEAPGETGSEQEGGSGQEGQTPSTVDGKLESTVSGKIELDGNLEDWANVDKRTSVDSYIKDWKVARDTNGNLYLSFEGTASTQWDSMYQWKVLEITQNGNKVQTQINSCEHVAVNEANGNTAAPYYVEAFIPASTFTDPNFTLTFAGTSIPASAIPVLDGKEAQSGQEATYKGIVIDGTFSDWKAVTKQEIDEVSGNGVHNLESTAMVFDGDYVYIYLRERKGGDAAHAGTHSNGKYAITTDLNRTMVFQLTDDGGIKGVQGATASHVGAQWEIAIPKSELPYYLETINFGLYLAEPFVSQVANLNGEGSNGSFNGIVYDGLYGDWNYFPHEVIEYATAGTQEELADAEGALYSEGKTLYGHVETTMPAHYVEQGGYELTHNITFKFNDDENLLFYPRAVVVDEKGNIDWNPNLSKLENGNYEVYLMSLDAWGTSKNLSDLNNMDQVYGKMKFTINRDAKDECEYELYVDKVAKKLGVSESSLKTISVQFGELGLKWITTTGASAGPVVGIIVSIASVAAVTGVYYLYLRKKKSKEVSA